MRKLAFMTTSLGIVALELGAAASEQKAPDTCLRALPASGQTTSYGTGSDGDLEASGALEYRDNGDGTITDLNTGLMWEKKADYDNSDVNCTSIALCPNPHDADNRYVWTASGRNMDGPITAVFLEQLNDRCEKDSAVSCSTDAECSTAGGRCGFAGYRDWRIPNWKELLSIVSYDTLAPSVASAFNRACTGSCTVQECSCTVPNVHWTSSTYQEDSSRGGYVSFYDGNLHADAKTHSFYVRAVRGGAKQGAPRSDGCRALPASGQTTSYGAGSDGDLLAGGALEYRDNGDGTLTDLSTGLIWEKKVDYDNFFVNCTDAASCPDPHDADNRYTWGADKDFDGTIVTVFLEQLNNRCSNDPKVACTSVESCSAVGGPCGFAGHRDWRIPNPKELQSILSYANVEPAVPAAFNNACTGECTLKDCSCTAPGTHWTSTTYQGDPSWAVFVGFFNGNMYADSKSTGFYARAVRGGP